MNILFYSSYFYPYISGLTQSPYRALTHLAKDSQITVLTFPHQKDLAKNETKNKLRIIRMPYFFKISKGYISPQSLLYFFSEVKKHDVIFLNLPNAEALSLAIMAKLFGKKIVSLYNCRVDLGPTIGGRILTAVLNAAVYLQLLLSHTIITYPDYMSHLAVGKRFKKKVREVLPVIEKHHLDKAAYERFGKHKQNTVWIGFVGRVASEKGIEYLVEAISMLNVNRHSGERSDSRIDLIFAGPPPNEVVGEQKYFEKIQGLLKEKNISYTFLGKLTNEELAAFYKNIDVLVLPSVNHTEAFGMVQAEAMLHGTPVVASDLYGVRIPIVQTGMGALVEPKNPQKLAQAIETILNNREAYANDKHVKKAEETFSKEKVYRFYRSTL